jgi:Domain of unknown function (DUF4190)/GYF domain 2
MQIKILRSGQQLGPYSVEEVRSHLQSGFLQLADLGWHEGMTDWAKLGTLPALQNLPLGFPSPPLSPAPTSGAAIASLVLGIAGISMVGLTSIPAVICGHLAMSRISKSAGKIGGEGLAIAGLITGYIGVMYFVVMAALFAMTIGMSAVVMGAVMHEMTEPRAMPKNPWSDAVAISRANTLYIASRHYSAEHAGKFPAALTDLVPKYLSGEDFSKATGHGYFWFGGRDSDAPDHILFVSRETSPDGQHVVLRLNGAIKIEPYSGQRRASPQATHKAPPALEDPEPAGH